MKINRNMFRYFAVTLLLFLFWACGSVSLASETAETTETEEKIETESETSTKSSKKISAWYKAKSGNVYYYDENGKKLKSGRYKIDGKYYYFDKNGIQRTGWQKIGSAYYYFNIAKGKKGYMVTSKQVNGITLKKNGKARTTSYSRKKLPILYKANVLMRSITKNSDTKMQKLKKVFDYTRTYYKYEGLGSFVGGSQWDLYYAGRIFVSGNVSGDCHTYAAIFAYLANAVGYKANVVSSGGHGWAEINNRVYDPDWTRADPYHSYFGMAYGTTGRLVPNYANNRAYVIEI